MKKNVLIIDDDLVVCKEIKNALQSETTMVYYTCSVKEGLEQFTKNQICLVIMDIHLAETNGLSFMEQLRKINPIPILALSSQGEVGARIDALKAGAAGYMEKSYTLEECIAHARSLIQLYSDIRSIPSRQCKLSFGTGLTIDYTHHQATLKGKPLELTRKEFDLLFCLAEHAGQVLSKDQLYSYVWKEEAHNVDEVVKAHIKALRKKLKPAGKEYIKNVWGIGYQFSSEDTD